MLIEVLEDLFFIERGYLNANHFVYRSAAPVLIDTGYMADFAETRGLIAGLGVRIQDVARIITTHTHCDHVGGHHLIQQASGCDIALHAVGRHFIETRDDWATWWRYYGQEAAFFEGTTALGDGDTVHIGPHSFEVLYTPGHAADGIVLYHPGEGILISSDTLWENDMAVVTERIEGSRALLLLRDSLHKIAALDVRKVYPGHGRPFSDYKGALERAGHRVAAYLADRTLVGRDLVKKIIVYTLMMKRDLAVGTFFDHLMQTRWFAETIDFYFHGAYRATYDAVMADFERRGIVGRTSDAWYTTVKP